MRKHNLKSYSVPRDPDRPLHYYWQNEVAKSEAILRTKRSRSTLHSDFTGLLFPLWTLTLLPAEWGSKIWSLTQHQEIPSPIDLYTITGRMRKQNLKTDLVPINPDRVHIIQFHLWTVPRVLASRSCSGPLHYYRQNEEAKSEVLLSTKRFRSRSWYIIPLVS